MKKSLITILILSLCLCFEKIISAKSNIKNSGKEISSASKPISRDLFGIFFEDLNFAADGGLYAELIQNRSFEYSPGDRKDWTPLTAWEYITEGYGYGTVSIETTAPVHVNNPH